MATNTFRKCYRTPTLADIAAVEGRMGIQLPQALKDHYLICNGGIPERKCWSRGEGWEPDCVKL
ncbi:MAG TPA: SMI1/KNR4 family protein, partial [Blastocatellia bacterium]